MMLASSTAFLQIRLQAREEIWPKEKVGDQLSD